MSQRSEIHLKCGPGTETLFLQNWKATPPSRGTILITHGVAEHSDCYHPTASSLASLGYDVWAWDLPGHGKSYGQRGYIHSFSEFTDRLLQVLEALQKSSPQKPLFLFGHSMGGLITLQFALKNPQAPVASYLLSSPALGVKVQVPFIKDQAARLLLHLAPRFTIPHQIPYEDLSRDQNFVKNYAKDPLRHSKYSAPLYFGVLQAMSDTLARASELHQPFFIQAAGQDKVVDSVATQEFFKNLGSTKKQLKMYPESYHEIFNDLNRQEVIDDLAKYLRGF